MKKIALILLICCTAAACGGKKEVKQVSQDSKATTEAFALAETIKDAFIANDMDRLQKNSTTEGFRDITANRKAYDSVAITFTPRWVEIEGGQLTLNISWKSSWSRAGKMTEERGMAVFMMEGTPLRVSKILQSNPFIYSGK